jgi:hypothetical protein
VVGLGFGAVAGHFLGPAVWLGLVLAVAGIVTALVSPPESVPGRPPAPRPVRDRPTLAGLGTRVEHILELAERQAEDHRATARREAEEIVAAARSEARAILDRARTGADG